MAQRAIGLRTREAACRADRRTRRSHPGEVEVMCVAFRRRCGRSSGSDPQPGPEISDDGLAVADRLRELPR